MTWEPLFLLLLGILLSAFFSGSETGFYRVTRVRLVLDGLDGDLISRSLLWFTNNPSVFVATTLVGNNLANYLTSFAIVLASQVFFPEAGAEILVSALFAPVVFLYGELIPKAAFNDSPNILIRKTAPLFLFFVILFSPLALGLWCFSRVLQMIVGETPLRVQFSMARHSLLNVFQQGEIAGLLTENQRELTQKLFTCSSMTVAELSRSLNQTAMVSHDADYEEIQRTAKLAGVSTLVVYKDTRRNAIGYISVLELKLKKPVSLDACHELPIFNATTQLTAALVSMQENRMEIAGVVNARGTLTGIVYRQDLVGSLT